MRFSELLADLALRGVRSRRLTAAELDPEISEVSQDSRSVTPGALFVAIPGMRVDAHDLVADAGGAGASAFLLQREVPLPPGCAAAIVDDTRFALGLAAAGLFGHPTEEMTVVGVTGTDGKTTTCLLTVEALRACGVAAGGMNSLEFRSLDEIEPNPTYLTTLDAPVIQARMRRLVDGGVNTAVLETTSHGIALHRVAGVAFDIAAYTNLTHEHLDFHGSLEAYRDVKLQLAELARQSPRKPGVAKAIVYNADEPAWGPLAHSPTDRRVTYGLAPGADLWPADIQPRIGGVSFRAEGVGGGIPVRLPLTGRFNVANALCALGICHALGLSLEEAAEGLARAQGLRGRMQVLELGQPFAVVIDYAHTPDGLEQVLRELRPLTDRRLLVVFGAPGDRDATKRPLMGAAVARAADEFVITADDPRQESIETISAAVAEGAAAEGRAQGRDFRLIPDRREAIRDIIGRAQPGDTVLLAGKGHEDRLLIGDQVLPWDEAAEATAAVEALRVTG
ncbi:MAG TPA: UDP-N-acetylmuramoyl-L-alanyl-D-glutamate--2,6-diaminopimelate ligase [Candidatus Solibacter sp.]|jgi:UDP-N-acetylmuramoyl-L-alanyl-D-glutamate--2,6-diaminopimelate ligase|nr:UDP-N-acetylmuramoyl-L-alanyl-D-glutamate--2,6-diaminopimelate ligase [Candidatus Solibacter sp.]